MFDVIAVILTVLLFAGVALAEGPKGKPAPPPTPQTASGPMVKYKAGEWNRQWRRTSIQLSENGDLLIGVAVFDDKGESIEAITLRVPPSGAPITDQRSRVIADKVDKKLMEAVLDLHKQVQALLGTAARSGKLNR